MSFESKPTGLSTDKKTTKDTKKVLTLFLIVPVAA
jgi:hypothetical protein